MVQLKLVALTLLVLWSWWSFEGAVGDPQLFLLKWECSVVTVHDLFNFNQNLNASLADLRAQISNQSKHFATAQSTSGADPVYAMFQCRNYLSFTDCATCFAAAAARIRNCSTGNGAHVVYDGCILRYENNEFLDQNINSISHTICGNETADESTAFGEVGQQVLMDLQIATPKISSYFTATKTQVAGVTIYAIAQCAETLTQDTCSNCLSIAQSGIQDCLPDTNGRGVNPPVCFMRYSETPFFADNQTTDISPLLKQGGGGLMKKWVVIGGGVACALLILTLISLFAWSRRSQSPKRVPRSTIMGATELKGPIKYKYNDLKAATKKFSEKNKLGEGGFGAVYKGAMKNGKDVAVKKLNIPGNSSKIDDLFESEVMLISNVHHKNLVQLLGYCSKGQQRILVYEYMANTSLDKFVFGRRKGSLNWKQRYDIILGIARGLTYLHEEFHVCIIHRDIKSSNILLDEQLQPKISDFGLVKLLPGDQSHLSTRVVGTLGYIAPEYVLHGQLSEKADTYSFGIVVLEIISGQKSTDVKVDDDDNEEYLLRQALKLYAKGMVFEFVDKSLNPNNYDVEDVKKVIGIALMCTQASAAMRPAMSDVVVLLNGNDLLEHMRPSMPILIQSNLRSDKDISASIGSFTSDTTTSNSILKKMLQLKLLALTLIWWSCINLDYAAAATRDTRLINSGCSPFNASNTRSFFANVNDSISELRGEISNQSLHFGTFKKSRGDVNTYTMFQCRNYLSKNDCLACFNNASIQIRDICKIANGARVIYNDCFLRYESERFYQQTNELGGGVTCGNISSNATNLKVVGQQVLNDLQLATPKTKGFYAATKTKVDGDRAIYAIAQCVESATQTKCLDCMQVGFNNLQSCLPNTDGTAYDAGCFMRYSMTPLFADNQTIDIRPYLKEGGSSKKWAIIGGVVGGVVLLLLLFALQWSRKTKKVHRGDILGATELKGPVNYKFKDLKVATKNFSAENKLGEGGFGAVYKGTLKNGKIVAIKKLVLGKSSKMEDDFESEVKLISNVHHRNLVRLLGCCTKGQERILVYEYMANSSLDKFLFGDKGVLNWKQRYDIILGTARGLAYLHEEFHVSIIHRDIKTANILLDDDLQPKIADFGLARLLPRDRSHLSTKFAGTLGYTAPEYAMQGQLSEKADTYSYGIVVLEIISGQKSTDVKIDEEGREYLLQRAWKLYERGMQLSLVDKEIDPNEYDAEEMKKIIEIALLCTQATAAMRPTMSELIVLLKSKSLVEHLRPTMPVFVETNMMNREGMSAGGSSNATASISLFINDTVHFENHKSNIMQFKFVALTFLVFWSRWSFEGAVGDPQLFLLVSECSGFGVPNLSNFYQNLNASFADLRAQVSNNSKHFATAQSVTGTSPVYAMFQCVNYLSITDCATCLAAAAAEIRNCYTGTNNGARVVYDGCFLRYESDDFFRETTLAGNSMSCGNQTAVEATAFSTSTQQLLMNLQIATPKITGFFAATKTQVIGGAIYAIAQCAETFTRDTCLNCLSIEQSDIQGCLPNTNGRAFDPPGCFMRYSDTPFFADNQTIDISPFLKQGIILGATELKDATKYRYSDLKAATKNFSEKNKLGEGGFGTVYKGTMKNGKVVAVKKLLSGKGNNIDDNFESEVTLISNVHHKNLVRLLGYCSKGQDRILVYEYMANNSLDKFLSGKIKGSLNWRQRYDIILGTARGLAYLHEDFHIPIIHRDIKSGNILLDEEFQPKISDFGLVKLLPGDQSHLSTRFAGTLGYTAPEYALQGQLSEKADTYSYGIVVLEIISGQKSTDVEVDDDGYEEYLLRRAWKLYEKGMHLELVDKSLDPNNYDAEEVKKVIDIALLCTQASATMRPAMSEVVVQLSSNDLLEHLRPLMPIYLY
ncbi:Cysteine-rich receptor-like protein kinase 2 [Glycine max]|nr:Cysteine-rich receptor-like protein kinase 2 [Glycine max]